LNSQEIIESGLLELYALNALGEKEKADIEKALSQYPALQNELRSIELTLEKYALSREVAAPEHIKMNIFEEINKTASGKEIKSPQTDINNTFKPEPYARMKYFYAAIAVLLLTNIFSNLFLLDKINKKDEELITLQKNFEVMTEDFDKVKQNIAFKDNFIEQLATGEVVKVEMKGVELSPDSKTLVYWNKNNNEVFLKVQNLPEPPSGKVYQLWAIADGTPVDAGIFNNIEKDSLLKMKDIRNAQAFAITLEPEGGSINPTLEQMYVIGNI